MHAHDFSASFCITLHFFFILLIQINISSIDINTKTVIVINVCSRIHLPQCAVNKTIISAAHLTPRLLLDLVPRGNLKGHDKSLKDIQDKSHNCTSIKKSGVPDALRDILQLYIRRNRNDPKQKKWQLNRC